jgi:VWFA-related protein
VGQAVISTAAYAQQSAETPNNAGVTIRAESRLVLVDVVVTDKKGGYVEDLTQKDFRVWQDDQEQKIASFSFGQSASSPDAQKRHLVLFFDDESMKASDQMLARAAAGKFLDANSRPGTYIAIIDYAGTMQVAQNFTDDTERLKKIASAPKMTSSQSENASLGSPIFSSYDAYSNRNVLMALRSVAKSLNTVPGRKSLIWLTTGFPLSPDLEAEMTALIDACNRANVAVYPVDVRGVGDAVNMSRLNTKQSERAEAQPAPFSSTNREDEHAPGTPHLVYVAQKTGGGGNSGTGARGGTTGTTSTVRVAPPPPAWPQNPTAQPRVIVPQLPPSAITNQQVLYAVAVGTGGFVISNSNDLAMGLLKIGKEQSEYYLLGYVPPDSQTGSCHTIKVKVERSGTQVRARSGFCVAKPIDLLAGKPISKQLEEHALGNQPGTIGGTVAAPFFYTSPETARVNLAMELPANQIQFDKVKGKYHAVVNVLGMAMKPDGTTAARFSDTVELDLDKDQYDAFAKHPYHYENQFYIAGGQYSLKLAVNSGDKYGQYELPLVVDHYDPSKFGISDLALSRQFYKVAELSTALDDQLLSDRIPLVTQGLQIVPSGSNRFKTSDRVAIYLEVYEPQLASAAPPKVTLKLRILDKKTGESKLEAGVPDTGSSMIPGNPVIPMGVPLPVDHLQPGSYVVELRASDSAGQSSIARKAEFTVE